MAIPAEMASVTRGAIPRRYLALRSRARRHYFVCGNRRILESLDMSKALVFKQEFTSGCALICCRRLTIRSSRSRFAPPNIVAGKAAMSLAPQRSSA